MRSDRLAALITAHITAHTRAHVRATAPVMMAHVMTAPVMARVMTAHRPSAAMSCLHGTRLAS